MQKDSLGVSKMNARQTFKTEEPIFIENYDLIKNYHEMLNELLASEVQAFEQNFDESVEQAAEELERISSVEVMDDLEEELKKVPASIDPFSVPTRVSEVSQNERPTVVVFLADHSPMMKKNKANG